MPGRYTQTHNLEIMKKRFGFDSNGITLVPRYNIGPDQVAPVVMIEGRKVLQMMRWGLVPRWAKKEPDKLQINARAETLAEKPTFRDSYKNRRCLVLADGFYEWRENEKKNDKTPFRFILKGGEPFAFAGLWDKWRKPDGSTLLSFAIITTEPNELIRPIHNRMPVILHQEHEELWLDPSFNDTKELSSVLTPYPSDQMDFYEVSTVVNSPKNDKPVCIEPKNPL
ncbi:MAG TPA: SOS response-associated peptidase [Thermodesulfobacteriota bacterium]|nr:SOS response-associated peptidase [Thermodesulfobacteriota bacterium]